MDEQEWALENEGILNGIRPTLYLTIETVLIDDSHILRLQSFGDEVYRGIRRNGVVNLIEVCKRDVGPFWGSSLPLS